MQVQPAVTETGEEKLYSNFINSLRAEETKNKYSYELKTFMKFHSLTEYSSLLVNNEERIKEYVLHLRSKAASKSRFTIFFAALKNFYEMNDVEDIKWRKLRRFMGEEVPQHEDRRYTHEEIHTLVQVASIRLKALIFLMASSGVRIGAITGLQLSHLEKRGDLYKINVYKGQKGKGQYYTFCTPECAKAIDNYLEFRERCGEKITPSSPLFRKDFNSDDPSQARFQIEQWNKKAITRVMTKALVRSGLVTVDHVNGTAGRKEAMLTHGFRMFFETMLVNSNIHETIIRKLTGHSDSTNLTQLYSKQTEPEMLIQYQKSTDLLTIDPANRLRKKVEKLEVEKTQFDRIAAQIAALEARLPIE